MKIAHFPAFILAVTASSVLAQLPPQIPANAYRKDLPDVMATPMAVEPGPTYSAASFTAIYTKAGKPGVAVLWNREFSDLLQQGESTQLSISSARVGGVQVDGNTAAGVSAAKTTVTSQDIKSRQDERVGPAEHLDLQMRSAFMQALVRAGVRVVDRNVAMRTTALGKKGDALDSQQVETEAIGKHAQLLMEVLNTRDPASPTGWATHVSVKSLHDGTLLAESYVEGSLRPQPMGGAKRFAADPRGGFREVQTPAKPMVESGQHAAEQTLLTLQQALGKL